MAPWKLLVALAYRKQSTLILDPRLLRCEGPDLSLPFQAQVPTLMTWGQNIITCV